MSGYIDPTFAFLGVIYIKIEDTVKKIFEEYIENQGYLISSSGIDELVDVYLDCQEWEEETMLTGTTEAEMFDWIKHTREVFVRSED